MKKIIVISPEVSKESATAFAEALGADLEFPYKTEKRDFIEYDYVFKYGFSRKIKAKKGAVFNKSVSVEIARDKLATFKALENKNISVESTTNFDTAKKWLKDGHTIVARKFSKESNGKGLTYCQTMEVLNNTEAIFWSKYIPNAQELRVYCWRDKVLSIYIKDIENDSFIFKLNKGMENHPQLVDLVDKVYKNIGLDFCGLDILTDTIGKMHLLEVNSAPILFPYTINKLVTEIKKEINNEEN
jgi:glutathione synthase/RimK-type ligase-like ATP-grasp enzyme